ncbi:hypothetical protein PMKS-003640 [Pichia membranifaciens]|uniref:Uncharacterized protein n=1 Tax=Pichia membranifaciens TaxID=4926 RepID=A0A1Q2YL99_9ASCO|nr:hypothetical protein PMKS-003640 [Pichia membranifaciens]
METKIGVFANKVELEQDSQENEHVIGHDSLNNKENILNIQDDFSVYENFQILTQDKTVYVTLSPTTVYVTVTKTVGTTTTIYPNTHIPKVLNSPVVSNDTPTPTKKIVSSSVFVVTTETAVVTSLTTTTAIRAPSTITPATTAVPIIADEEEAAPLDDFATTRGELNVILGGGQKYTELVNSSTTAEIVRTIESPVEESTNPAHASISLARSNTEFKATSEYPPVSTSVPTLTTPLTSAVPTLSIKPFSTEISSASAFTSTSTALSPTSSSGALPLTSSVLTSTNAYTSRSPVNSSVVNRNVTSPTISDKNQNATGLEQLLKNFSPYTELPSADYEYSSGGNSIKAFTVLKGLLTVMAALVGATI